jgi:hypothetical protein
MVKRNRWLAFLFLIFVFSRAFLNKADSLSSGEPYALALGQAYTALAKGPLAPLWNPAGNYETSGIQGSLAFCLLPDESTLFYAGGSVAATDGPAVSWTSVRHSDGEGEILGTFSYPLRAGLRVGGGLAYLFDQDTASVSFNGGVSWRGERLWLGASGFGLESMVAEGKGPSRVLLGAGWRMFPWMKVAVDLHFGIGGVEVALGGEARAWTLRLRWGSALSLGGGLTQLGFGLGFPLMGLPVDIGVGLMGSGLQLVYSFGLTATFSFPAW